MYNARPIVGLCLNAAIWNSVYQYNGPWDWSESGNSVTPLFIRNSTFKWYTPCSWIGWCYMYGHCLNPSFCICLVTASCEQSLLMRV